MRALISLVLLAGQLFATTPADGHRLMLGAVGQTKQEIQQHERETGHHLAGVRVFRRWGQTLFDGSQRWARDSGHTVFISIKSRRENGAIVRWRDIASAGRGSPLRSDMLRQAREIKHFHALVYVVFNHEPEAKASWGMGSPADFVAAWRRLVSTYRAAGVRNARYVWTMTGPAFGDGAGGGRTRADLYYPGDAYVDDIAGDTYNWGTCRSPTGVWQGPGQLLDPQRRFGLRHPRKGLMLLEWGTVEDRYRPWHKAQWLQEFGRLLASPAYRQFRAVLHWDDRYSGVMAGTGCDFSDRTSPTAFAAWRSLTATRAFSARTACQIGDCVATRRRSWNAAVVGALAVAALVMAGLAALVLLRRRSSRTPAPPPATEPETGEDPVTPEHRS